MSQYQHLDLHGDTIDLPIGKVLCVGRNYMDHIVEMGGSEGTSPKKGTPVLFMKPSSALCHFSKNLNIPSDRGECHNELEVAFLIGKRLSNATREECRAALYAVSLGLDLTLRELQNELRDAGLPWERCKSFDNSCPVSAFSMLSDMQAIDYTFQLTINNELRQDGNTDFMLWPTIDLLVAATKEFTLEPGDIVMTGTPKGVGPLFSGDKVEAKLDGVLSVETKVN